jgi:hypothetical protein
LRAATASIELGSLVAHFGEFKKIGAHSDSTDKPLMRDPTNNAAKVRIGIEMVVSCSAYESGVVGSNPSRRAISPKRIRTLCTLAELRMRILDGTAGVGRN